MYTKYSDTFFGFTDDIKEPGKTKIETHLISLIRYKDEIYNMVSYLVGGILEGKTIEKEDNVWWYKKDGTRTRPKTIYKFYRPDKEVYWEMKKTDYDFCKYLIENGLDNQEAVEKFISQENKRKKESLIQKEQQELERKQQEIHEMKREEEIEKIIQETLDNLPEEEVSLMNVIFENVIGNIDISRMNYKLLALIHNYDIPQCKSEIISWLHNDNKASIKVFEHITGLSLPKGYKDRIAYLNKITSAEFTGMKEYKPRKKSEKKDVTYQTFYELGNIGKQYEWKAVQAEALNIAGYDCFILKKFGEWVISLAEIGMKITGNSNRIEAINFVKNYFANTPKEKIEETIENASKFVLDKVGKNPMYAK